MSGLKGFGLVALISMMSFVSAVQAREPALNIQAPATAPILEAEPVTPVVVPVVQEPAPVVKPAPAHIATNGPLHHVAPVVAHTATNVPVPVATNAVVLPVTPVPVAPVSVAVGPTNEVAIPETDRFFVDTWQHPSFQVGTRMMQVSLSDTTRGTPGNGSYFGTITEITEVQDHSPDKVYLQARLPHTPLWLGVSYDHVTARTMDDGNGDGVADMSGGDGNEEIKGFIPYLQAVWDNKTRFTPYAEVGYAFYQAKFLPNSWGNNGQRYVDATSSVNGFELGGGLGVRLYKNLSADFYARSMTVDDITGDWYFNYGRNYGGPFVMTMSYVAYGAGLSCRF